MHIASWSGSQPFIHELTTSQCNHEYILLRTQGSSHLPVSGVILFMILYFSWTEGAPSYRILLTISPHNKHFKLPYQIIWGKVALRPCCKKQAYLDTKSLATWPRSMLIFDISLHQSFYILIWTEDGVIEYIYKSIFLKLQNFINDLQDRGCCHWDLAWCAALYSWCYSRSRQPLSLRVIMMKKMMIIVVVMMILMMMTMIMVVLMMIMIWCAGDPRAIFNPLIEPWWCRVPKIMRYSICLLIFPSNPYKDCIEDFS